MLFIRGGDVPSYILDRAGRISIDDIDVFFAIRPQDVPYKEIVLSERTPESVSLGPGRVMLDDRWDKQTFQDYPAYWLAHESVPDSQIMLESGKMNSFKDLGITSAEGFAALTIPMFGAVCYDTFRSWYDKNSLVCEFYLEENGFRDYHRTYSWIEDDII